MQKLTLRMEAELVQSAKAYASVHGKSLSQLVADYFRELTSQSGGREEKLPPLTQSLRDIMSDDKELDEKSYKQHLEDKYL